MPSHSGFSAAKRETHLDTRCRAREPILREEENMDTNVKLEDLVHRYEAGERDPALMGLLNELAWEGFHDPWEEHCGSKPVQSEETPMEEEFDPTIVYPVSLATIERALKTRELHGWKGPGGRYLVQFRYDADSDREVRLYLSLEGKSGALLKLRIMCDRRVDRPLFPEAHAFCNEWNAGYRWPKALLDCPDPVEQKEEEEEEEAEDTEAAESASGALALESQYDLAAGIHQALFDDLVFSNLSASWDFWNQARAKGF